MGGRGTRLATITEATDYAEGVRRTSVAQFEERGGKVVAEERYASDITGFRTQLQKLFAAEPDALHLAPQSEFAAGTIIKQAREVGYEGPIYAETISVGTTSLEVAGDAATGMKAITADLDPDNEKGQEVLANFRERYNYVRDPAVALGVRLRRRIHHRRMPRGPTTIRTRTASVTACTTSLGAGPSVTTTASTPTAKSWVFPGWWWKSYRKYKVLGPAPEE